MESASRTGKRSSRRIAATTLLPLAMPPVRPSFSMESRGSLDKSGQPFFLGQDKQKDGPTKALTETENLHGRATAALVVRRRRAAFTVLLMSMVMVMGPTPPGTGESAPAAWMASG